MNAHLAITSVVILFLAFELNSVRSAFLIGEEIAGPSGAQSIQNAVTPPFAAKMGALIQLSYAACIISGFWFHGWLIALLLIPGSFIAVGIVKSLFPSPKGKFHRGIIIRSMMNRYANFEKEGDHVRARAMKDLIDRLGYPLPESLS